MARIFAHGCGDVRQCAAACAVVLMATATVDAIAAPAEVYIGLDSRFSDNIRLAPDQGVKDIENRASLSGNYQTNPGNCTAIVDGEVVYSVYAENTYDPQTQINAGFTGLCELARGLTWELDDQVREVARSDRRGDSPDNRTRKNVFQTGPRYRWRLSNLDFVTVSARYGRTDLSDPTDVESERVNGSLAWTHLFGFEFSAGLSAAISQVELDTAAEVRTDSLSVTFSKGWAATSLSGSLGGSEIETKQGSFKQKSDGVIGDLNLQQSLDSGGALFLKASRELTDRTSDYDIRFDEFTFQVTDSITLAATSIETGLNKTLVNGDSLAVGAFANRSDYLESIEQEDSVGLRGRYTRWISPRFSAVAGARYQYLTFASDQIDDEIVGVDLGLTYSASRRLEIAAKIGRIERTSDARSQEYEENWLLLSVDYRLR